MKVLLFHAAASSLAIAKMTEIATALRADGHNVGERFLPAFKAEKEPTDKIMVALSPKQAHIFKDRGVELVRTFGVTEDNHQDLFIQVELPETDDELKDFDVETAVAEVDGPTGGKLTLEQAKAAAVERGLEVTAETTRLDLERMLGLSISDSIQAADRRSDQVNNTNMGEPRIGVRTSNILPSVNGVDLERMNDEQLRAAAADMGIRTTANMRRDTIVNAMTKAFAKKVEAPEDAAPKSPTAATDPGSNELPSSETDLPDLSTMRTHAEVDKAAAAEGVTLQDGMTVEDKRNAIQAKREETKAHG